MSNRITTGTLILNSLAGDCQEEAVKCQREEESVIKSSSISFLKSCVGAQKGMSVSKGDNVVAHYIRE